MKVSLNGLDVSNWQSDLDLNAIQYDFVICKATEGITFVDPTCDGFVQRALAAGKCVGVYHFARTGSAVEQARYFVENIRGYIGKAALFLDWENAGTYDNGVLSQGVSWAKTWLDEVYNLTGVKPMIYMSKSVCREYDWASVANADYGLWMAQYPNYDATGYQAEPWTDSGGVGAFNGWAIHQYTGTGRLDGYGGNLDLDIFYGDVAAWNSYAAIGGNSNGGSLGGGSVSKKKSVSKLAKEVIAGKWGNGDERKQRLTAAGYDYEKVQVKVNEILGVQSLDEIARAVIRGEYGNGQERIDRLTAAGWDYSMVQSRVNEMM